MDKNELERYKQEMMKLYGRSRSQEAEQQPGPDPDIEEDSVDDVSPEIVPEEIEDVNEDAPDDSAWHPHSENDQDPTVHEEDEFNTKYPEPDLTNLTQTTAHIHRRTAVRRSTSPKRVLGTL